jgi:DNA segregation ATPase FtsK/SpoIIIE-like protein
MVFTDDDDPSYRRERDEDSYSDHDADEKYRSLDEDDSDESLSGPSRFMPRPSGLPGAGGAARFGSGGTNPFTRSAGVSPFGSPSSGGGLGSPPARGGIGPLAGGGGSSSAPRSPSPLSGGGGGGMNRSNMPPSGGASGSSRPGAPAATGSLSRPSAEAPSTPKEDEGNKNDDKKSSGIMGGFRGMLGGKKDGDKPAEKKPDEKKPAADGEKKNPFSAVTGALGGMLKRGQEGDKPAEKKPAEKKNTAKADGTKKPGGLRLPFFKWGKEQLPSVGEMVKNPDAPPAAADKAPAARAGAFNNKTAEAAAKEAKAARPSMFTRIGNFLRPPADASPKPPPRPRTSRAPVVESEGGLTLDNWLDIIGVSLLGGAGLLTLSALSGEQAAIRGLLRFLGELLGWGAFIVPLTMAIIGMWLVVRHFGDTAPSVDPVRVVGVVIGVLAVLILMQYIDSLSYPAITTPELLALRLTYSWQELRAGGGAIGAELYLFLIRNFTELGGLVVVGLMIVVSIMLATRSSASQMLAAVIGIGRSVRESIQRRAAAQRARRQLEMERRAAERAAAEEKARAAVEEQAKLAAAATSAEPLGIRINFGTDAPSASPAAQAAPVAAVPPPAPPETGRRFSLPTGSLLGRFSRSTTQEPAPPPLIEPLPLDDTPPLSTTVAYGGMAIPPDDLPPAQPASGHIPFEKPAAPAAAASAAVPPPAGIPFDADSAARSDRLNALRNGHTAPPATSSPPPRVVPPSQLPSVQPTPGPQQPMLTVPFSSPVVNQTRAQRPVWRKPDYRTLLSSGSEQEFDRELLLRQAKIIEDTLSSFGAPGRVVEVNTGPVITQFGVEPDYVSARGKKQRVKVGAIAALDKDLQLALGAKSIRVEAPVPGKGYVGIEVPNKEPATVRLRDVMESPGFNKIKSPLAIALGQSVSGAPVSADLVGMPHLLIAGTTGSGKSVMVNAIICSIISRHTPDTVKFIMVDPKRVELIGYNGIPHLVAPVVVELERIVGVLKWVTREMDDRYKRFSDASARNIEDYNKNLSGDRDPMPYIVVIIDELADLMMQAPDETERAITRIAALARATGIHLVIATQRPSVDVVTGLIRANFPARIAFAVASGVDSRVILDQPGAEKLLGRGDMLYLSADSPAPVRLQGVFVSDLEINNLVRFWKMQAIDQPEPKPFSTSVAPESIRAMNPATITAPATYSPPPAPAAATSTFWDAPPAPSRAGAALPEAALTGDSGDDDDMYEQAVELVRRLEKASVSLLQRRLRIGYTRAARLIDMMEARGVVGPAKDGSSKPRDVLPLSKEKPKA